MRSLLHHAFFTRPKSPHLHLQLVNILRGEGLCLHLTHGSKAELEATDITTYPNMKTPNLEVAMVEAQAKYMKDLTKCQHDDFHVETYLTCALAPGLIVEMRHLSTAKGNVDSSSGSLYIVHVRIIFSNV